MGLAAALVSPVFFHRLEAAPGRARRLQAVRLSTRQATGHVGQRVLARRALDQEVRPLAASSRDGVVPVRGAVPRVEAHGHLLHPLAEECRISGARSAVPGRAEHCPRRHWGSESGQACALAAGPAVPVAVKDGNSVASDALPRSLREVLHRVDSDQTATETGVPEVPPE